MGLIQACALPANAFLRRYNGDGGYADCYVTEVDGAVPLSTFVEAFYSSDLFKLELCTVGLLFRKPWSDALARRLAAGETEAFSAWTVEARDEVQVLMHEVISHKTRSWLMVEPAGAATRLYFGTAVLPVATRPNGEPRMSALFNLLAFHKLYARMLLAAARGRLRHMT